MATAIDATKSIRHDHQIAKDKDLRRPEKRSHLHQVSSNSGSSGSAPKRYQSVFTEGTPISSFGVRPDENQLRSQSPSAHPQPQIHQRPLKPVKEFLTTQLVADQQIDVRQGSSSQASNAARGQTDNTVQNINAALAKTLNVFRPVPTNSGASNVRTNPLYADSSATRPATVRSSAYAHSGLGGNVNGYHQGSNGTRGPLPAELITKRPSSTAVNQNRINTQSGPMIVHQTTTPRSTAQSVDSERTTASTAIRVVAKSLEIDVRQLEVIHDNHVGKDENADRTKGPKNDNNQQTPTRLVPRKRSPAPAAPNGERPQRSLPEVSVNPHIESPVHKNGTKGVSSPDVVPNSGETNAHRHHIRVEPTDTFKRVSSPAKHQHIADIKPSVTVQHQRPLLSSIFGGTATTDTVTVTRDSNDPLNDAYIERHNPGTHLRPIENGHSENLSRAKQNGIHPYEKNQKSSDSTITSPSSTTEESDDLWKNHRQRYSVASAAANARQRAQDHRPPARLKNYEDESDSETTPTETQNQHADMAARHGLPPSDLGSDAWSDLTSEFSDTKLRKHPNVRTSTPNMTRQSSSISSKEVGQIRKQLKDLQVMYNDLLKLLDIDLESVRSSLKSSTSSQIDHHHPHSRKHRFRKVVPLSSARSSHADMKEINQRFGRLESSIVTLAESIAKLSTQVQMQRNIKEDIHHLRQEVADLRQHVHRSHSQPRPNTPAPSIATAASTISQPPSRFASPHGLKLPPVNNTNPSNASTSYMPSTSTIQRTNSVIDPRQARKIEQFFGREAMLRYFLSLLNYEEYTQVLEDEKIGIYELPYVSERKLQSLGIPYGPCARIIYEAQQYFISLLTLRSSGIDV